MENVKSVIKALVDVLMTVILVVGIAFIALFVIGIKPFVVETGSMEPAIMTGSLTFVNTRAKYSSVKERDIISFKNNVGNLVTHRVIKVTPEGLETQGDSNNISDGISTTGANFVGKVLFTIPKMGSAVAYMQTTKGKIILTTIIIVIFFSAFLLSDDSNNTKDKNEEKTKEKVNKKSKGKRFKN